MSLVKDYNLEGRGVFKLFILEFFNLFLIKNKFDFLNINKISIDVRLGRVNSKFIVLKKIKLILTILELFSGNVGHLNFKFLKNRKILICTVVLRKVDCYSFLFFLSTQIALQKNKTSKNLVNIFFSSKYIDIVVLNFIVFSILGKYLDLRIDDLQSFKLRLFFNDCGLLDNYKYHQFLLSLLKIK